MAFSWKRFIEVEEQRRAQNLRALATHDHLWGMGLPSRIALAIPDLCPCCVLYSLQLLLQAVGNTQLLLPHHSGNS